MSATIHPIHPMYATLIIAHANAQARRFTVDATRADGRRWSLEAVGGTSIDAAIEAMERGGLGSVVKVRCAEDLA